MGKKKLGKEDYVEMKLEYAGFECGLCFGEVIFCDECKKEIATVCEIFFCGDALKHICKDCYDELGEEE